MRGPMVTPTIDKKPIGPSIYLETFGCQMNELDSELVTGHLQALGYQFVDQAAAADVVLFNTCSVREQAENKVFSRVGRLRQEKDDGREVVGGLLGCLAEREGVTLDSTKKRRGPYQASRSHPLGLTAKEQVVLRHLSEGRSNKEIAEELNRSQRTVEHHVSAILGKLDAPNRMAAILRVQQEPWLQGKDTRTSRKTG